MAEDLLRTMLSTAVAQLRVATDLTMDEIIGLKSPSATWTSETRYSLGIIVGAAAALRSTPREMLEDHDLLTAPKAAS